MDTRRALRPALVAFIVAALVIGCVNQSISLPEAPRHWLTIVCLAGPHVPRTVRGDASDPDRPVWADRLGKRFELRWPPDFVARFSPNVEVIDPAGQVVVGEGDDIGRVLDHGYVVTCPSNGTYGVLSPTEPAPKRTGIT